MACYSEQIKGGNSVVDPIGNVEAAAGFPMPAAHESVLGTSYNSVGKDPLMDSLAEEWGVGTVMVSDEHGGSPRIFYYGTGNPARYDEEGKKVVRAAVAGPAGLDDSRTFSGGVYEESYEATTLYRAYDSTKKFLTEDGQTKQNTGEGSFFTTLEPSGPMQTQVDSALDSQWLNGQPDKYWTGESVDGAKQYVGRASAMEIRVGVKRNGALVGSIVAGSVIGGGPQVVVEDPKEKVRRISDNDL